MSYKSIHKGEDIDDLIVNGKYIVKGSIEVASNSLSALDSWTNFDPLSVGLYVLTTDRRPHSYMLLCNDPTIFRVRQIIFGGYAIDGNIVSYVTDRATIISRAYDRTTKTWSAWTDMCNR